MVFQPALEEAELLEQARLYAAAHRGIDGIPEQEEGINPVDDAE